MVSVFETDAETMAKNTLTMVTMLDYSNFDIFSDSDANSGGGDLLDRLISIRLYLLSVLNSVYASTNVTTSVHVYSLMQQTQLIGCVVQTPDQVSTYTCVLNMGIFGSISDGVDTIGNESVGIMSSFFSNLNVDIASQLLDGAINIGKAVSIDKSNITAYQNGISATQTMLDIVLLDMLRNQSPREPGFVSDLNDTRLKGCAKRSGIDYEQTANIVNNSIRHMDAGWG